MIYKNIKGTVLVYSLVLVTLSLLMAMVILNNTFVLQNEYNYNKIKTQLGASALSKWELMIKYANFLNTNGNWFIDNVSCPSSVTMSGSVHRTTGINTILTASGSSIYCRWTHNGSSFDLYFNDDVDNIVLWKYQWFWAGLLSWSSRTNVFPDGDNTRVTFSESNFQISDGFDDNLNSDNYAENSTGSTVYPNGYQDDDADAKRLIYGFLSPDAWFQNIFWANTKTAIYINKLLSNSGTQNVMIDSPGNKRLYIDADQDFEFKIYSLDRDKYNDVGELTPVQKWETTSQSGSLGYLQSGMTVSPTVTWSEFFLDFANNDYAFFLKNLWNTALFYRIKLENLSGSWVYVNPIDDSGEKTIKVLSNHISINEFWNFLKEEFEVVGEKICGYGFSGANCDVVANVCTGILPAQNTVLSNDTGLAANAPWQNTTSGNDCYYQCVLGFAGANCDVVVNICTGSYPTQNVVTSNDTLLSSNTPWQNTTSGNNCYYQCTPGFTGIDCDIVTYMCTGAYPNQNVVTSNDTWLTSDIPWQNTTSGNACYFECTAGYSGANCDPIAYTCTGSYPTQNVATSNNTWLTSNTPWQNIDSGNDCYYECTSGHTGANCDPIVYTCTGSYPAQNIVTSNDTWLTSNAIWQNNNPANSCYYQCASGFTGPSCTVVVYWDWRDLDSNCDKPDVVIGTQTWAGCNSTLGNGLEFGQRNYNMGTSNYNGSTSNSYCYNYNGNSWASCSKWSTNMASYTKANTWYTGTNSSGDSEVDNIWGKFYIWNNRNSACPAGYHVPSHSEWEYAEEYLYEQDGWWSNCRTSSSAYSCSGIGWRQHSSVNSTNNLVEELWVPLSGRRQGSSSYRYRGRSAVFWTSSQYNSSNARGRYFQYNQPTVYSGYRSKSWAHSIRCIAD